LLDYYLSILFSESRFLLEHYIIESDCSLMTYIFL